jgi:cell division protein FtsB
MINLLKNPLAILIFTIITMVFYVSLSKTQQKNYDTLAKIEKSQQETLNLEEKNKDLEDKLQNIDSEHIIRDEFLMQKPGEYVIKVPGLPEENKDLEDKNKDSNLDKWKKVLFN